MIPFSRGDFIHDRYNDLADFVIRDVGATDVTTTFALFREVPRMSGSNRVKSNLGEPKKDWSLVVADYPCVFGEVYSEVDERALESDAGKLTQDMKILWTSFSQARTGDDLRLDYDGRFYNVQAAGVAGGLHWLLLDTSQNQRTTYEITSA